jgi:hypothetical protein
MKNVLRFTEFINESLQLNEAFKSSILSDLTANKKGALGKEFFSTLSSMGIAASEITDLHITQVSPAEGARITKANPNAILVYFSTTEKINPYAGANSYGVKRIEANVPLAIVKGGKYMGLAYDRWASKNGKAEYKLVPMADAGKPLGGIEKTGGTYGSGLTSLKKMAEMSDVVYVIDPSNVPSSTDLRHLRKEEKSGATAFINDKDFKKANFARYQEILKERAANDDVDKLVADAIESLTTQIKDGFNRKETDGYGAILIGKSPKGRDVKLTDATHLMNQILNDYSRYVEYMNSVKVEKERFGRSSYYEDASKEQAKSIKDRVKKIEKFDYAW